MNFTIDQTHNLTVTRQMLPCHCIVLECGCLRVVQCMVGKGSGHEMHKMTGVKKTAEYEALEVTVTVSKQHDINYSLLLLHSLKEV